MTHVRQSVLALALILSATGATAEPNPTPAPTPIPPAEAVYPEIPVVAGAPHHPPGAELTPAGRNIRGVYVPYPRLRKWTSRRMVRWLRDIGATAAILDIKDDRGRVTFTDDLPLAQGSPHGEVRRMAQLVEALQENGIYVIGRLVCFKDMQLSRLRPGTAIRDKKTGKFWRDHSGLSWVDPHSELAHEHIASIAVAAQAIGFDEIQLDYVRFPVDSNAHRARYPNREGEPERYEVIARLLARVDRAIDLPLSIDVFGLTAYHPGDEDGLGQSLEHLAPYIDAISPMVYLANWPKRYWDKPHPARTHALVNGAVAKIRRRLGDEIAVRPLLQAFKWRAKNFGLGFIHNQIDAAETGGSSGHLFWNQSGNYYKVKVVWDRRDEARKEDEDVGQVSSR
ncbi:MAG: hypothetical protein JRF63_02195 [Deltaproteobacteria bacterium]|nr:hypothetical protein [Deltaproteobacteria bacterium]